MMPPTVPDERLRNELKEIAFGYQPHHLALVAGHDEMIGIAVAQYVEKLCNFHIIIDGNSYEHDVSGSHALGESDLTMVGRGFGAVLFYDAVNIRLMLFAHFLPLLADFLSAISAARVRGSTVGESGGVYAVSIAATASRSAPRCMA